jgi:predicted CXXCH cytochrome family protein
MTAPAHPGRCNAPVLCGLAALAGALLLAACGRGGARLEPPTPPIISAGLREKSVVPSPRAAACVKCHPAAVQGWLSSQHARANRLMDPALDGPAFAQPVFLTEACATTTIRQVEGRPEFLWAGPGVQPIRHAPEAVIGITPLRQYLLPFPGGRLQCLNMAFDPRSNQWFNCQDDDRTPADWGHWMNRGMNWNVQCAACHMTGFRKNYDSRTDSYQSTWDEMGIGCAQCHGDLTGHADVGGPVVDKQRISTNRYLAACASCHSRREELTGNFQPGDSYHDHYRLALVDQEHLYYADGQVKDEDFEYGSFVLNRMHLKGVTCLDCHDPHSGKLRAPVENNALCLTCHAPPGQRGAVVLDLLTHSHHEIGTVGDRCVDCHMPHNTYMGRDQRRDHAFTSPDPLLNKEAGIPDACTRCHTDKGVDWSIEWCDRWYGEKMNRPQRARARALTRLRAGEVGAVAEVIRLARADEISAWRAALVSALAPWSERGEVRSYLSEALADSDPLVRSAAVRALAGGNEAYDMLKMLRRDVSRLVRIDAATATLNPLEYQQPSYSELQAYLRNNSDQPAGALHLSQMALAEDKPEEARRWAERAAAWDRSSAAAQAWLGRVLTLTGNSGDAEAVLLEACRLEPGESSHAYTLALLYGQMGRPADAATTLRKAVALEPGFGRAWYNLGLALAQLNDNEGSLEALRRAETIMPESVDPPYARATIHVRLGQAAEARAAAQRAVTLDPKHALATELLRRLK